MERIFFTTTLGELRDRYHSGFLCHLVAEMAGVDVGDDDIFSNVNLLEVFAIQFPERFYIENCTSDSILENHWRPHPEIQSNCAVEIFRTAVLKILCETYGADVELNFEIDVFTNEEWYE